MCVCARTRVHVHVKGILREKRRMQGGVIELEKNQGLFPPLWKEQRESHGVGRTSHPNILWSVLIAFY